MKKAMMTGMIAMMAAAAYPCDLWFEAKDISQRIKESVRKGEMTKEEATRELEGKAREYRKLSEENPPQNRSWADDYAYVPNYVDPYYDYQSVHMLRTLIELNGKTSLPLVEEMALTSTVEDLRRGTMRLYIYTVGATDSLPFVDRLLKSPNYLAGTGSERLNVYNALRGDIEEPKERMIDVSEWIYNLRARLARPSGEKMGKICAFLLEKAQTEESIAAKVIDEMLCDYLSGYAASVQRTEAAERLSESDDERVKTYWRPVKEKIGNTPVKRRKDFRAKGELLDPKRKEK